MSDFFNSFVSAELSVLDFITEHFANPVLDKLMIFLSDICAHGEIWIAVALIMLCFAKTRRSGMGVAFALIFGLVIGNMILKPTVGRIRPYELTGFELIVPKMHDYSFPSGHTLASFEAAGALLMTDKRYGIPALVLAFMIAFSRLYLYVHYPSDVFAGIVLGLIFAFIAVKLTDSIITKHPAIVTPVKHK